MPMPIDDSKTFDEQMEETQKFYKKQKNDFEKRLDMILVLNEITGVMDPRTDETPEEELAN